MIKQCPQCKHRFNSSAFRWDLDKKVCNRCYSFNQAKQMNKQNKSEWEIELIDILYDFVNTLENPNYKRPTRTKEIKSFIKKIIGEVIDEIELEEKHWKSFCDHYPKENCSCVSDSRGYNLAVSDLDKIKKLKKKQYGIE